MADYYNLRPRPSVTATEGFNVEQAPEGPGPMAAELAGPAPNQAEEGQVSTVEVEMEGRPESPQALAQSLVSSSISLPDLTLISGIDDEPPTTQEDIQPDTAIQDTSTQLLLQNPSLAPEQWNSQPQPLGITAFLPTPHRKLPTCRNQRSPAKKNVSTFRPVL